ncbi:MAG: phage recombination protein Bet [Elusimicrobiota bacterium]|jgi:phage recombination protein Bet|nr:phage recombination protein Bet [Elusimicrobiota bacterium]
MSKELATAQAEQQITMDLLKTFVVGKGLTDKETADFINIAVAYQLNPFKREIHVVAYGQGENRKCTIIVGYETYLKRAERTGKLDGWRADCVGDGAELKAVVTIYRKDWREPFMHEVLYEEAVQKKSINGKWTPTAIWAKQPQFMLKKVAIAQGFRMCFPDEMGGLPYIENEYIPAGAPEQHIPASPVNMPKPIDNAAEFGAVSDKNGKPIEFGEPAPADEAEPTISIRAAHDVEAGNTIPVLAGKLASLNLKTRASGQVVTEIEIGDGEAYLSMILAGDRFESFEIDKKYVFADVKVKALAKGGKVFIANTFKEAENE